VKFSMETQGGKRVDVERLSGFVYLTIVENACSDYETETSVRLLENSLGGNEVDGLIYLLECIKKGAISD
jgi:hypothetical protein